MGSSTHTTGIDAYVTSAKPSATFQRTSKLWVQSPGGATQIAYVRTNNPVPRGATVTSVKLHLYGAGNWGASAITVQAQLLSAKWTDSSINYNNRPSGTGSLVSVSQTNTVDGTEWIFDITALWQTVVNGGPNYGIKITTTDTTAHAFYSYDYGNSDLRPVWEFSWSDAPDAPTELSPAGGASVTLQKTVLNFNFHDVSGNTAMASCRVQINPTNTYSSNNPTTGGFTNPAFDSGEFSTSDPQLDTSLTFPRTATVTTTSASAAITASVATFSSADVGATISGTGIPAGTTITAVTDSTHATMSANATASGSPSATITRSWAGLSVGGSAWWAVQVKDGAGIWSNWSDPVTFKRVARGALSITSPTGGTIQDPTQQIIWSLTGATQTAYQVIVADDSNPTKPLWDTGRKSGTANSWTIPKGVITDESANYRITVRTWDDLTRTPAPGDKIHTEAVATFTFAATGTADPITNLQAIPRANGQPGMWIQWDRASAPNFFEVRRDGVVLDTDLNPADLASGPDYHWLDRTATPYVTHTWRVVAKTATGIQYGPTVNGSFDLVTTWLEDVSASKLVPIVFRESSDGISGWEAPQIGVVAQPLNAKRVVRQTQGQAGLQGSCSGIIMDGWGDTADNWRKNLEWMRARPSNKLQLSTNGTNITVVIGDVVIAPYKKGLSGSRQISFNFWQQ